MLKLALVASIVTILLLCVIDELLYWFALFEDERDMMRMFAAMIRWFPITCVLFLAVAGGGGVNAQTDLIQGPWHLEGNATGDVNNIPVRVLYIPLTERERNAHPAEIPETGAFVNLNAITTVPDSDGNHVSRIEAVMVYEDEDASGGEDDNRIVSSSASESRVHVGESQDKLNATYINSGSEQPYEAVSQQLEFLEKFKQQLEERELKIREKELEQQAAERKRLNTDPDGRFHASDITPDHPLYHLSTPHAPRCMNDEQIRCCDGLAFGFEEGMERLKEAGKDWRVAQIWDGAVGYGCYGWFHARGVCCKW